jgi:hypothetical protein
MVVKAIHLFISPVEKKRKTLTLSQKVDIIHAVDSSSNKRDVAKKFDIASSTLSTILRQKGKIMNEWTNSSFFSKRKKLRGGDYADVDQALLQGFTLQRACNVPINGPMRQEKSNAICGRSLT